MDFEGFGVDFNSIDVDFLEPPEWLGVRAQVFYQDEAVHEGRRVESGSVMEFKATPPPCLEQPWLFLDAIQN